MIYVNVDFDRIDAVDNCGSGVSYSYSIAGRTRVDGVNDRRRYNN